MMRAPDPAVIHAAELRVAQSARDARDGLRRARAAWRAKLAQPATLALAAGTAGLLGFWLARRLKPRASSPPVGAGTVGTVSAAGLLGAFIMRYGMQYLPFVVQQVRAARRERAAPAVPELSKWPAPGEPGPGMRH